MDRELKITEFELRALRIPTGWHIAWNNFYDIEPDNDLPIPDVFTYFLGDIAHFTFDDYFIDLEFYGSYFDDRKGVFVLCVAKGDFMEGVLYEYFVSRSAHKVIQKIELYMALIAFNKIKSYQGLYFDCDKGIKFNEFLFSVVDGIRDSLDIDSYL